MRTLHGGERSVVSLRDVARCVKVRALGLILPHFEYVSFQVYRWFGEHFTKRFVFRLLFIVHDVRAVFFVKAALVHGHWRTFSASNQKRATAFGRCLVSWHCSLLTVCCAVCYFVPCVLLPRSSAP